MTSQENGKAEPSDEVLDQAAEWHVRLAGREADVLEAFERWLEADSEHRLAFAEVEAMLDTLDAAAQDPEMARLRRDALDRAHVGVARPKTVERQRGRTAFRYVAAVAALVLISLAPLSLFFRPLMEPSASDRIAYVTEKGESRSLTLADNSRMTLDTQSRAVVRMTPQLRSVRLDQGQAFFEVSKDPDRPFEVTAGGHTITALGTEFNVNASDGRLTVALVEGRVVVRRDRSDDTAAASSSVVLSPGEELSLAPDGSEVKRRVQDMSVITAWRQGKVVFQDESLLAAARLMNRYSNKRVVIDRNAQDLKVSGVFNAGDTDAFIEAIQKYFNIERDVTADNEIHLHLARLE
ncbi:MAG: DUF4974 domain-containing protein [Alphaproteobacteria bacterium]|nr:DUF4974 domain-containing protein [Alphaproteobacteria bacterium]